MHEIEIIGLGISLTFILHLTFYSWIDKNILPNRAPWNCLFCISLWVTIGIFLFTFNWYAVFIPITFHYATKLLDKWI